MDAEKLATPGFDARTVQPVASRYTDGAILAPHTPTVQDTVFTLCVISGFHHCVNEILAFTGCYAE